jgi:hypothetical protein
MAAMTSAGPPVRGVAMAWRVSICPVESKTAVRGLGYPEVDDDIDASGLGSATVAMKLVS